MFLNFFSSNYLEGHLKKMLSNSLSQYFRKSIPLSNIVTTIAKINEPWCLHMAVVMCQCGLFYQASAAETPALAPLLWVLGRNQLARARKKLNSDKQLFATPHGRYFGNSYWIHKRQDVQWKVFNPGRMDCYKYLSPTSTVNIHISK